MGWPSGDFLRTLGAGIPHLWPRKGWRSLGGKTGWRWGAGGDGAGGGCWLVVSAPVSLPSPATESSGFRLFPRAPSPCWNSQRGKARLGRGRWGTDREGPCALPGGGMGPQPGPGAASPPARGIPLPPRPQPLLPAEAQSARQPPRPAASAGTDPACPALPQVSDPAPAPRGGVSQERGGDPPSSGPHVTWALAFHPPSSLSPPGLGLRASPPACLASPSCLLFLHFRFPLPALLFLPGLLSSPFSL